MEKPGQGIAYPQIIDRPELKTAARNLMEGSVTFSMWLVWLSWVFPVLAAVLGTAGVWIVAETELSRAAHSQILLILGGVGVLMSAVLAVASLWVLYNRLRLACGNGERRKNVQPCPYGDLLRHFSVDIGLLEKARRRNCVNVFLRDSTLILPVEPAPSARRQPDLTVPAARLPEPAVPPQGK